MSHKLTTEEQKFVRSYVKDGNASEAFRKAYPEDRYVVEGNARKTSQKGNELLKKPWIIEEIDRHSKTTEELSLELIREFILSGQASGQTGLKAAEAALKYKSKDSVRNATQRWAETLCNINAKTLLPEEHERTDV